MNRATLESKDPAARFAGVYVEVYRGYKIRIKKSVTWGMLVVSIAGDVYGHPYGTRASDVMREARTARLYIDDSHERPDAYTWSRAALEVTA